MLFETNNIRADKTANKKTAAQVSEGCTAEVFFMNSLFAA